MTYLKNKNYEDRLDLLISNVMVSILNHQPLYYKMLSKMPKLFDTEYNGNCGVGLDTRSKRISLIFNPNKFLQATTDELKALINHMVLHVVMFNAMFEKKKVWHHSYNLAMDLYLNQLNDYLDPIALLIKRGKIHSIPMNAFATEDYVKLTKKSEYNIRLKRILDLHLELASLPVDVLDNFTTFDTHDVEMDYFVPLTKLAEFGEQLVISANQKKSKSNPDNAPSSIKGQDTKKAEQNESEQDQDADDAVGIGYDELLRDQLKSIVVDSKREYDHEVFVGKIRKKQVGQSVEIVEKIILELMKEKSKVDYQKFLINFVKTVTEEKKYSTWTRINRKYPNQARGKRTTRKPAILCGIDTSGSVWTETILKQFAAEIKALKAYCSDIVIIGGDTQQRFLVDLRKDKFNAKQIEFKGGGGTDLQFIWDYAKEHGGFDGIVVNTDGIIPEFNDFDIPTSFVLTGHEYGKYESHKIFPLRNAKLKIKKFRCTYLGIE